MKSNKSIIVPFFISHQGCPNLCVFCDQKLITGNSGDIPAEIDIFSKVEEYSKYAGYRDIDIAFYGGSFTSLDLKLQRELLGSAAKLKQLGKIKGIRLSTRPDSINDETISLMKEYGVDLVELGVQSFSDDVLSLSKRGHTAQDAFYAVDMLAVSKIPFGIQLMTGLPGDTPETSVKSCKSALSLKPELIRLYPALVLEGTELAEMYRRGDYLIWSNEDIVSTLKIMLWYALKSKVRVARIGLQSFEGLNEKSVLAGFNHPAAGDVVFSELFKDLLVNALDGLKCGRLMINASPSSISSVAGHKGVNRLKVKNITGASEIMIKPDSTLARTEILIKADNLEIRSDIFMVNYEY